MQIQVTKTGKTSLRTVQAVPRKATSAKEMAEKLYSGANPTKTPIHHKASKQQPVPVKRGNAGVKKQQAGTGKR